jgi:hypothetical protein
LQRAKAGVSPIEKRSIETVSVAAIHPQQTGENTMPMKPEPKAPPTPPPTDNVQRRQNLQWSEDAMRMARAALQRHMTSPQVPGRDRTS